MSRPRGARHSSRAGACGLLVLFALACGAGEPAAFGEDGTVGHGTSLHGRILQVPLAFRWPGRIAAGASEAPAESVDILPSVLGLLELPAEEGADGRDLSELLRLSGQGAPVQGVAFAELEPRAGLGDA